MIAALVAVFVLSGAAGLIYESLWSRYLGLFVGHSAYAQIIVLVIFLGGMSLGAHLVGRRSEQIRRPLIGYAAVELVVGILAIVFHDVFVATTDFAYRSIFPSFGGFGLTAVKWAIAGLLILPQSILLGATFPLMSSGVMRLAKSNLEPGRVIALLYFSNSLGAAFGVLLAGLWLIGKVGLPGVLLVAGFINVLIAAFVFLLARAQERFGAGAVERTETRDARELAAPGSEVHGQSPRTTYEPAAIPSLSFLLLSVAFGTAVASFIYEIAWIRMLSLVLGSATHSFELMLSAFILGLALGAFWIRKHADTVNNPLRLLGMVQWMMGLLAVGTLPLYLMSFDWMSAVLETVASNENGYRVFTVFRYGVSLLIMLPATFCAGMTLPLITRLLMQSAGERAIGAVYAVNTLGSILGVILAGLLLMPLLGLKRLLILGALIDIALGVWLVARSQERAAAAPTRRWPTLAGESILTVPLLLTVFLITTIAVVSRFDISIITSGVYRHGFVDRGSDSRFPFYRDGRTATVSVERNSNGFLTLSTNGKPDASIDQSWLDKDTAATPRVPLQLTRDVATQYMLPLISLAHRPRAELAAVIGQGSGITSHVLLGSPYLREVATIEIEPEMVAGSAHFMPANRRVFEDARARFVIDDAKSYFASSGRKFDLIVSEPSNPWVSGVSGLFTQEFYARVKDQLTDNGVFGQWLHLYEISDGLVNSVLAAIDTVFPAYEVFYTSDADIVVVAAKQRVPVPDWGVVSYPDIAHDMRHVVSLRPSWFEALRLAGRDVLHPMLRIHAEPNSDFFPVLDLNAEKMRFMHANASGYTGLKEGRFDLVAALSGRRLQFGVGSASPTPEIERSQAHALSARLHAVRTRRDSIATNIVDEELGAARLRIEQLEAAAASDKPPASWHSWMDQVVAADADLHGGTSGVVDTAFFGMLRRYATRHRAPMEARVALNFLESVGAWNWSEAAQAAKSIMVFRDPIPWIPPDLLRNAGAAAFILTRDTASAKTIVKEHSNRANDRFRERLLGSILVQIDSTFRKELGW